jgi:hypothetical protein
MRGLLTVGLMTLVPLAALAQWHGTPGRTAPMRPPMAVRAAPMAHPFMVRPAPMPVRGFRPNLPGSAMPWRPRGRRGFRSGHVGFGFGFGVGRYPFGVPPQNRCFSDAFFDPFFCTRRPVPFRSFGSFASFGAYPFYSYPLITDSSSEDYSDAAARQMAQQTAQASAQASDLTAQIEQLREELQQLRQQQSSPAPPASAPVQTAKAEEQSTPTTLVFRDGRRSEVENYAIVGNTLWVFSDQRRKKIPIAELDLKATQQANADQGVDFVLPSPGK